ncbi:MAG: tRNA glutamyl-Q(34) synthetase GluQRS [Cyanobacteriota bacterium]|nr:tRNA glutamyl-Q(34) synthetase GluQRS [Cyanobacteriota bacterium]
MAREVTGLPLAARCHPSPSLPVALPHHLEALFAEGLLQRQRGVRGRFAPSPSGALHLGNLRTALLSWLQARSSGGEWLLRIDDLDTPRNRSGAEESIVDHLRWLGLDWDGPLIRQSQRRGLYSGVLSALRRQGWLYPCRCSRRMLADISAPHGGQPVYPGTCRTAGHGWGPQQGRLPSWRLRMPAGPLAWREPGIGAEERWLWLEGHREVGDVVLRRADGFLAYHLATAIDELTLGISEIVRGEDLRDSTAAQVGVMAMLGAEAPRYWHVPLWREAAGRRLSKRDGDGGVVAWRRQGGDAAGLIGALAASLGWLPAGTRISARELLQGPAVQGLASLRNLSGSDASKLARVWTSKQDPRGCDDHHHPDLSPTATGGEPHRGHV